MLRRFSYLASVSVIASMAINPVAQAMNEDLQAYTKKSRPLPIVSSQKEGELEGGNSIQKHDVENNLLLMIQEEDARLNPSIGNWDKFVNGGKYLAGCIAKDGIDKFARGYNLAKQACSGDYSELASEIVDSYFSSLIGEGQKNFFKNANKGFDPEVLRKVATKLADAFFLYLSRIDDSFGITDSGERVTHYNKSLFSMMVKQYFPDVGGVMGVSLKILDNQRVKAFIEDQVIQIIIRLLPNTLKEKTGQMLESTGQRVGNFAKDCIYGEASEYPDLWGYLSHHIQHYMRNLIVESLKKQKAKLIKEIERPCCEEILKWYHLK